MRLDNFFKSSIISSSTKNKKVEAPKGKKPIEKVKGVRKSAIWINIKYYCLTIFLNFKKSIY